MAFGRTEKHLGLPGDNMVARFRFHLEMAARGSTRSLGFQIRSGMTVGGKAGYVLMGWEQALTSARTSSQSGRFGALASGRPE